MRRHVYILLSLFFVVSIATVCCFIFIVERDGRSGKIVEAVVTKRFLSGGVCVVRIRSDTDFLNKSKIKLEAYSPSGNFLSDYELGYLAVSDELQEISWVDIAVILDDTSGEEGVLITAAWHGGSWGGQPTWAPLGLDDVTGWMVEIIAGDTRIGKQAGYPLLRFTPRDIEGVSKNTHSFYLVAYLDGEEEENKKEQSP